MMNLQSVRYIPCISWPKSRSSQSHTPSRQVFTSYLLYSATNMSRPRTTLASLSVNINRRVRSLWCGAQRSARHVDLVQISLKSRKFNSRIHYERNLRRSELQHDDVSHVRAKDDAPKPHQAEASPSSRASKFRDGHTPCFLKSTRSRNGSSKHAGNIDRSMPESAWHFVSHMTSSRVGRRRQTAKNSCTEHSGAPWSGSREAREVPIISTT